MKKFMLFAIVGMMSIVSFTSCSDDNNDTVPGNSFKVRMTDSPGDYVALDMEIVGVDVYHASNGWINLSSQSQMVSVLDLTNGNELTIANSTQVEAGLYTQLRVRFGDESNLTIFGQVAGGGLGNVEVNLSWVTPKEVVININHEVSATAGANVLIDFNVAQSILQNLGDYVIQPVLTEIKDETTGIQGSVEGSLMAAVVITDGQNTYSTYIDAQNKFLIRGLNPGTYDITVIPNTMDPDGTPAAEKQINNVVIVQGQIKQMGVITLE